MRIILVRHGETTWNIEGRYQGQEDTPLSERGLRQGHLLAEGLHISLLMCASPATAALLPNLQVLRRSAQAAGSNR